MTERLVARTAIMRPIGVTRPPWNPYLGECCGVLWMRSQASCIYVYACDRERCRGENMHLHALRIPALGWDTGHACHHIEKERGASVSVYVYGEDSNRASDRWLRRRTSLRLRSLTVGCLCAWPAAYRIVYRATSQTGTVRPVSSKSRKRARYRWA